MSLPLSGLLLRGVPLRQSMFMKPNAWSKSKQNSSNSTADRRPNDKCIICLFPSRKFHFTVVNSTLPEFEASKKMGVFQNRVEKSVGKSLKLLGCGLRHSQFQNHIFLRRLGL